MLLCKTQVDLPTMPMSSHHQLPSHPVWHFKRGGLTSYTNIISPSTTITSSILFQERMTYPLYHYHITISYHHIQYTISREEDLPPIPISSHHQLQSHPVYCFKRGGLTNYINITSLSATVIFNIPFQEQMTYLLNWTYSIVIYQYPILSREHLHPELSLDVELTCTALAWQRVEFESRSWTRTRAMSSGLELELNS